MMSNEPEELLGVHQPAQKKPDMDGTVHRRPEKDRVFGE